MRTSYTVAQKAGAITCAMSVVWIYFLGIQHAFEQLSRGQDWVDGLMRLALPLALVIPGVFLCVLSCQLMRREATRDRIKNTLGLAFGMGAFVFAFFVLWLLNARSEGSSSSIFLVGSLFVSVLVVLPLNAGVCRYVMRASGVVPVRGEFVGKGSYMLLAFLLWWILSPIGIELYDAYQMNNLLDVLFGFLPILIPYILYRLAVKYLVRDTIAEQVALDFPSMQTQDGECRD
jgi:hypothetical protein